MFNNFSLNDEEIVKIIEKYNPLILKYSFINKSFDEDLCQEIKLEIVRQLSKNLKK